MNEARETAPSVVQLVRVGSSSARRPNTSSGQRFRTPDFFAGALFAGLRFAGALFTGAFFVTALFAGALFTAAFFVVALFVAALFVGAFFAVAFFVAAFLAGAFFTAAFFVAAFFTGVPEATPAFFTRSSMIGKAPRTRRGALLGFITASRNAFAAPTRTFFEALNIICSPVAGLRPMRAGRSTFTNFTNPGMEIVSPFAVTPVTTSVKPSRTRVTVLRSTSACTATALANSRLFMGDILDHDRPPRGIERFRVCPLRFLDPSRRCGDQRETSQNYPDLSDSIRKGGGRQRHLGSSRS